MRGLTARPTGAALEILDKVKNKKDVSQAELATGKPRSARLKKHLKHTIYKCSISGSSSITTQFAPTRAFKVC